MIKILLFLFPSGISIIMKEKYFKEKMNIKDYILYYVKSCIFINLFCFGILTLYSLGTEISIEYLVDKVDFIFKYLLTATFMSILFPIIDEYVKKNVQFKISIKEKKIKNVKK